MKIIEIKHIEDCFDGSYLKEIRFDHIISQHFIYFLRSKGKLAYYPDFARPFFKFEFDSIYNVKGVEGNNTVRVLLKNKTAINSFKNLIKSYASYK